MNIFRIRPNVYFAFIITFGLLFVVNLSITEAQQTLEEALENLSESGAKAYIDPVASAFGTDMNAGWVHKAPAAEILGLDLEIGFVMMGAFFSSDDEIFSTSADFRFSEQQAEELASDIPDEYRDEVVSEITATDYTVEMYGPTAIGSEDEYVKVVYPGGSYTVTASSGQDVTYTIEEQTVQIDEVHGLLDEIPLMPLALPQLSIGTAYGTKLTLRFIPNTSFSDKVGDLSHFGLGIQHNPAVWLNAPLPVDFSLGFYSQKLKVEDFLEVSTTAYGLNVSKTFGVKFRATPYAGLMFESSTIDVDYTYTFDSATTGQENIDVSFDMDGENKNRLLLGAMFEVAFFALSADFNIGNQNSFSTAMMLSF